jgi:hypothetical protein
MMRQSDARHRSKSHTQAFGVSGCRRCVRRRANTRKYRDIPATVETENTRSYQGVYGCPSWTLIEPCASLRSLI